jgi:hypothetical protein
MNRIHAISRAAAAATLACAALLSGCSDNCDQFFYSETKSPSCEEETCIPTPPDCTGTTPASAFLNISLSEPLPVVVRIYRGAAYETGDLIEVKHPSSKTFGMEVPLGTYSVTALYIRGGDSVLAVDGGEVTYRDVTTCERTCRVGDNDEINLSLQ